MNRAAAGARSLHRAPMADIRAVTAYTLLRIRVDVFVVEQQCAYPELDGRDLEAGALQWWIEQDGHPVATLRTLVDTGAVRIGRVATDADHRGQRLAAELVRAVIEECGARTRLRLDAQTYLQRWYEQFGFVRDGADFVEDGIPHLPMTREAAPATDDRPAEVPLA